MKSVLLTIFAFTAALVNLRAETPRADTSRLPTRIYLSFDDGPCAISYRLDSIARTDSIPITVFLVGSKVKGHSYGTLQLARYRSNPFIRIGNHSYCHANLKYKEFYRNPSAVVRDMELNEDTLQLSNKLARLPGRNTWRVNLVSRTDLKDANIAADTLANRGFLIFGWDCDWRYDSTAGNYITAYQMAETVTYLVKKKKTFGVNQVVILCHDPMLNNSFFLEQLGLFIQLMKKEGLVFDHLENYVDPSLTRITR